MQKVLLKFYGVKTKLTSNDFQELTQALQNPTHTDFIQKNSEKITASLSDSIALRCSFEIDNANFFPNLRPIDDYEEYFSPHEDKTCYMRNELRKRDKLTDIKLTLPSGHVFNAHKLILASNSSYFESLINTNDNQETLQLSFTHFTGQPDIFEKYLELLYVHTLDFTQESTQDVIGLSQIAHDTEHPYLKYQCSHELLRRINKETFRDIISHALKVKDPILKNQCDLLLTTHPKWKQTLVSQFESDVWAQIVSTLQQLNTSDALETPEEASFVMWEMEKHNSLRKQKKFIDMVIKLPTGEEFPLHKIILATQSQYFSSLLCGEFVESKKEDIFEYHLSESDICVSHELFELFIQSLYTAVPYAPRNCSFKDDAFDKYSFDELLSLARFAYVHIVDLENDTALPFIYKAIITSLFSENRLNNESFWKMASFGLSVHEKSIGRKCFGFIQKQPDVIEKHLAPDDLDEILDYLDLMVFIYANRGKKPRTNYTTHENTESALNNRIGSLIEKLKELLNYDNFEKICNKAIEHSAALEDTSLKNICMNFAHVDINFEKTASKEAIQALVKLATGINLNNTKWNAKE